LPFKGLNSKAFSEDQRSRKVFKSAKIVNLYISPQDTEIQPDRDYLDAAAIKG